MSSSWLALHLRQRCVIKTANAAHSHAWKTVEMFEREANILSHLHHPRIPQYLDFFSVDNSDGSAASNTLYLVQEYVDGHNLAEWIQGGRHFTAREVLHIARETAGVLAYLHQFTPPLLHRDLKPSNILLTADQQVYVVNFGTVRDYIRQDDITGMGSSTIVGTYGYMPFEQFEGRATPASDVYALGLTLLYLLTHQEPGVFKKTGQRLEFAPYVSIAKKFVAIIEQMIAADWTERYQTGAELQRALERLSDAPLLWLRGWRALILTAVIAAFLAGTGAYLLSKRDAAPPVAVPKARRTSTPVPRQPPDLTLHPLTGRLLFDGQPVSTVTSSAPEFSFLHTDAKRHETPEIDYENGQFQVLGLFAGAYVVSVEIDANRANPPRYPGDLIKFLELLDGHGEEL